MPHQKNLDEAHLPCNAFEAIEMMSEDKLLEAIKNHSLSTYILPDGFFKETLLHKAALKQWSAGLLILLNNEFNIHSQNCFGQTALHYAVASHSISCVRVFLERGSKEFINHFDNRGHSALHDAAALGLNIIIEDLIAAGACVNATDKQGMTPLHKAVIAKDPKSVFCLLKAGADLKAEDHLDRSPLSLLLYSYQDVFEHVLNFCFSEETSKGLIESRIHVNFSPLLNSKYKSQLEIIREILTNGPLKLISHPLCETFLSLQWLSLKKYFVAEVCLYFMFVLVSTLLIFNKIVWFRGGDSPFIIEGVTYAVLCSLMIFGATLMLLRQCCVVVHGLRVKLISLWYILNCIVPILVLIVVPGEYTPWQDHLAAITLLLAWSQGMLHIGRFPKWGIYVTMFTRVARNLIRIFLIFFCMFIAFVLSFNIIWFSEHSLLFKQDNISDASFLSTSESTIIKFSLPPTSPESPISTQSTFETSQPPFHSVFSTYSSSNKSIVYSSLLLTFMKTLTMMVGDLNFDSDLIRVLNYLPGTSYLIFIAFVFLMSILLSNMLVALAVSDVQGLRDKAEIEKLYQQEEVAEFLETTCKVIATIFETVSLKRITNEIQLPSVFSDIYKVHISTNDHNKNGTLVVTINRHKKKTIYVTSQFVTRIRKCILDEFTHDPRKITSKESQHHILFEQNFHLIKNGIELLNEKCSQIILKLSNLENRMEKLE